MLLPVRFGLFFRQGNTEYLIGAWGKVLQDLFPRAAKQDRLQLVVELIQAPISQQLAIFIFHPVFLEEAKCWAQPAAIYELDYREQLFQFVLERRPCQHKRIAALQLLDGSCSGRCPITDSLRLVEDDQVGLQSVKVIYVSEDQFVAGQVEKLGRGVLLLPLWYEAFNDLCVEVRKFLDLSFPLIFHGRGCHDQHSSNPATTAQKFSGRQRLHGLAQSHVIGQNHPATAGDEHGPTYLVRKQAGLEHVPKRVVAAPQFSQKLALQLQSFRDLVFPIDIV